MQTDFSREQIAYIDREQRLLQIARRIDRELGRVERESLPLCKDNSTHSLASKKWRETHPQQYLEYQRRWAKHHAEQIKEYNRCFRENHPRRVVKESFLCELEKMADKVKQRKEKQCI